VEEHIAKERKLQRKYRILDIIKKYYKENYFKFDIKYIYQNFLLFKIIEIYV